VDERLYLSNPPVMSSSARAGQTRLHAIVSSQKNRWTIKLRSSDFRSIVGLPWVI